ncbi:aminoglycoside phosphotransferase family protein [Streptomyces albipurpureus]|uniref:Aminoglycoside phosphotransferase family protein n=1 Tax=Streptomyces albipurpureus TaxID=2897419 RepID=A0ABT0UXC6_9ACTN|nr:aminoglycoside phosphotransferase family protein [Streptomyces sp. CWNU-1]MCM2392901.1 aminoglycoside phosphotransferase family protein [Streptomyces sp. CWNU-1]
MGFEAPQRLVRALDEGDAWLAGLPSTVEQTVNRLGLTVDRTVVPGGRSSCVLLVRRADGTPAALKLAPPAAAPEREQVALERWDGWGAVRPLAAEGRPQGALLLERLHPEVSLRSLPDAKALLEAAGIVRRLWVEPPPRHDLESVAERTERQSLAMRDSTDPLVRAALAARDELVATSPETLLLHGSFRQGKVLAGDQTPWVAVGPDPLVGERAYDLARLVRDRVEDLVAASAGASAARRRVKKLADSLEVDAERVRGWALFRAVESAGRVPTREAELRLEFASWL